MKNNLFLGREYGVLPKCLQLIIFINQGLYQGGAGTKGWIRCWKWSKLKRISCWKGNHKWFEHTKIDRTDCIRCGEQLKY